ncbi:MAG: 50S ribosomal protein L18 [Patescibacteria group bacterium]
MRIQKTKKERREKRRIRIRSRVTGTRERPRLNVFRSIKGLYLQLIDDEAGKTMVSVGGAAAKKGKTGEKSGKVGDAYILGKTLAEKAKMAGITVVVFDRAGYAYHGRVKAAAEGAREGGLVF